MVLSLKQRIFLVPECQHLEHSYVQTRRSFQRIFLVRRDLSDNAIKALFERTGNVNDERIGNVCPPRSAVKESNSDYVHLVVRERSPTSVRSIFVGKNHINFIC
ncbi:hypothetical protein AVEN_144354-1 [Araneus ventricosus]|uniref:DUF4817 domain-containing protein n=1 Tax=Araneus ventricosus TaxID=182803 RepID=A0A4Y2DJ32_ARAVE|nr:hypothetical protein AVEN_144354-1 [Araneus ventricosus]